MYIYIHIYLSICLSIYTYIYLYIYIDHHLKPIMQNGLSYIRDSQHFLEKIKTIGSVTENAILVTAYVVGLYPNIPHQAGLKALNKSLERRDIKKIPTEDLVRMAEFVLNNNIFDV